MEIIESKTKHHLKCAVFGCNNKKSLGFSLHSLPKICDTKRRSAWIKLLKINVNKLRPQFVVCSAHFIPADFFPGNCFIFVFK